MATRDSLNIRIRSDEKSLIDRAASSVGKSRTDFILEAARRAAEETLLDQRVLSLDEDAYALFIERLDAPARPNDRLTRSLAKPAPWDEA